MVISGEEARGHLEACRERINKALENTDEGRLRRERQHKRENEALAKHLEKEFGGNDEERSRKVARQVEQAIGSERPKRKFEDMMCKMDLRVRVGKTCRRSRRKV